MFVQQVLEAIDRFSVYHVAWDIVPGSVESVVERVCLVPSLAVSEPIFENLAVVFPAWTITQVKFWRDCILIILMYVIERFNHITSCSSEF